MKVPEGKFDKKGSIYGRREQDVCSVCLGTCCAAARSLVSMLARIEVIQPVRKVNSSYY